MKVLSFVILSVLVLSCSLSNAKEKVDYTKYHHQQPKQRDCQMIEIDQSEYGGKIYFKRVCFYDVTFGNPQQTVLMWVDVKTGEYGFTK